MPPLFASFTLSSDYSGTSRKLFARYFIRISDMRFFTYRNSITASVFGVLLAVILVIVLYSNNVIKVFKLITKSIIYEYKVPENKVYVFPNLAGPNQASVLPQPQPTSWRRFSTSGNSQLAVLLTDSNSAWLGLVQGLMTAGIPFTITTDLEQALRHSMLMVYPHIQGRTFSREQLQRIATATRNRSAGRRQTFWFFGLKGGGLNEAFGVGQPIQSAKRFACQLNQAHWLSQKFDAEEEFTFYLGNQQKYDSVHATDAYPIIAKATKPLYTYQDGTPAITIRELDAGTRLIACGLDLGDIMIRNTNARGYEAYDQFANDYMPGLDVCYDLVKQLYLASDPNRTVALWPLPNAKKLMVNITHDIDFTRSIKNAVDYAMWEDNNKVQATYFIQTKYIRDWNDDKFFNDRGAGYLAQIAATNNEIGSHSVAHSYVYRNFPLGTGTERYPEYLPYVMDRYKCYNGSVLGELRVSKFLLENLSKRPLSCQSFRPGHLSTPGQLPEALVATGYRQSSAITACQAQSYRPFFSRYSRGASQLLDIVELPIAIEDEIQGPMIKRLSQGVRLANHLKKIGGYCNVLIHTDTLGQKMQYQQLFCKSVKQDALFWSVTKAADWYRTVYQTLISVTDDGLVTVTAPETDQVVSGLTVELQPSTKIEPQAAKQVGDRLFVLPDFKQTYQFRIVKR